MGWFCPGLGPVLVYLSCSECHHSTWPDKGVKCSIVSFTVLTAFFIFIFFSHLVLSPHTQLEIVLTSCQKHQVVSSLYMSQHTFSSTAWHGNQLTHMQHESDMTRTEMLIFDMIIYDTNLKTWFYSGNIWRIRYWTQTGLKLNVDVVLCLLDV